MSQQRSGSAPWRRLARTVRAAVTPDRAPGPTSRMHPIFVGGTGRSGTTITSGLLGRHPAYRRLNTEVKFISNTGGLCDLVEGRTTFAKFERRLTERWYDRGPARGVKLLVDRSVIDAALPELRDGLRHDRAAAAAAFTHRLLDPLAEEIGARGWIEMTPNAAETSATLVRMFPTMKLLHLVRDGRDVACSVLKMSWGPDEPHEALDWWGRRVEAGFEASRGLPEGTVLDVQLEDLVVRDRERTYTGMLSFLGLDDQPAIRAFFEDRMPADAMHSGRWRTDIPADQQPAFEAHYWRLVDRLVERGYPYRGEPREVAKPA